MLPPSKHEGAVVPPNAPPPFDPVAGTIVAGKYRVEGPLGEGGMGVVVAARHLGLDQRVAIKFLLPDALRSEVAVERFMREARVTAKVRSEHVARVHDIGTLPGGLPYIVMEHLDGCDLRELIARGGPLAIDEACEIILQACEALAEVHAAGIVHRDLKPSNLFVTRRADGSPVAKILDFGISKLTLGRDEAVVDSALTATAAIMGSPSYMSPEQLKSTKEVDPRADVWSLGAVLYEAITAKAAFRGQTVPQVCAMIASEDPPLPSGLRPDIPIDLERAILGALVKDVEKRLPLVELASVLARFAPDRARGSLERIEVVLGARRSPASPTSAALDDGGPRSELPVLPLATTVERGATVGAWGRARGRQARQAGQGQQAGQGLRLGPGAFWVVFLVAGAGLVTGLSSKRLTTAARALMAPATSPPTSSLSGTPPTASSSLLSPQHPDEPAASGLTAALSSTDTSDSGDAEGGDDTDDINPDGSTGAIAPPPILRAGSPSPALPKALPKPHSVPWVPRPRHWAQPLRRRH